MKNHLRLGVSIFILFGALLGLAWSHSRPVPNAHSSENDSAVIVESPSPELSAHPAYWLNSGAEAYEKDGVITTLSGNLPAASPWYGAYRSSNPTDTDGGLHPQNIFRLLTKESYGDHSLEATVTINGTVLSASPNRNETNGILLMLRYADQNNLYYAGLRVDGQAVIKKKLDGTYHTLASVPVFSYVPYGRETFPNLIPLGIPIGIKAEIRNAGSDAVRIDFYIDIGKSGTWIPILTYVDTASPGNPIHISAGHAGFRSDFLEVSISDLEVEKF